MPKYYDIKIPIIDNELIKELTWNILVSHVERKTTCVFLDMLYITCNLDSGACYKMRIKWLKNIYIKESKVHVTKAKIKHMFKVSKLAKISDNFLFFSFY